MNRLPPCLDESPLCDQPLLVPFIYALFDCSLVLSDLRYLGKKENVKEAQKQLLLRAKANSLASLGKYMVGVICITLG